MKTLLTMLALLAVGAAAQAGIQWSWTNAGTGTEHGTFITDGELTEGQAPAGVYTVLGFSVTASDHGLPVGSVSGGEYEIRTPDIGFDWDGAAVTLFWRASGTYTNGFGLYVVDPAPGGPDYVGFSVDSFRIEFDEDVVFLAEELTPVLLPEENVQPVEGTTLGAVKALYR